ncbi:MAG: hypothetical protein ACTHOE_11440 [Conexibacter sp.]
MKQDTAKRILIAVTLLCSLAGAVAQARAAAPPEQRGWELVSPSEKHGNDVIGDSSRTHAAAGMAPGLPSAVAFASLGGFADAIGGGIATEYLAQRTAQPGTSGWSTHAITPPQQPMSLTAAARQLDPAYEAFSPELTKAIFRAWSPLADAPNVAEVENLYAREDLRTPGPGSYRLLTSAPAPLAPIESGSQRPFLAAATDDLAHVLLESRLPLAAGLAGGNPMLFKVDGGAPRLLAPLPDCPLLSASAPTEPCDAAGLGAIALHLTADTLSADGSRAIVTAPVTSNGNVAAGAQPSRLWQLDDHDTASTADDTVVQLNASELAALEQPQAARFQAASADGARVWFTSGERLTEDAPAGGGLYLWQRAPDASGHHLTFAAPGGTDVLSLGASRDGRRIYFAAPGQLLAGGPPVVSDGVYLWQQASDGAGGTTSFVAAISVGDAEANAGVAAWSLVPRTARVTPDGRALLFEVADETGVGAGHAHGACEDNPNVTSSKICGELYVYRADRSTPLAPAVACASCQPSGAPTSANAWLSAHAGAGAAQVTAHLSHALSDDGRRVFFSSAAALVPEDANGTVDAYEYDVPSGTLRLLSSGHDPADSWFLDASANGDDAYFVTREQLVGWDVDRAYDLYDARVGGGFPEPPAAPPSCDGDACRGAGHAAPAFPGLGSATLVLPPAASRPAARKACRRGFVRRRPHRGHGRARRVRRRHAPRHHHRRSRRR